jgi:hypothetical protein
MSVADNGLSWRLASLVTLLAIGPYSATMTFPLERRLEFPVSGAGEESPNASEQSEKNATDTPPVAEWMRGVPRGCRLVSFDLLDGKADSLEGKHRVDVLSEYAISDRRRISAVVIQDAGILEAEASEISEGARSVLRVTLALTPHQANRLRLAAACSTLRMKRAASGRSQSNQTLSIWDVWSLEDRTEAIEARLADTGAGNDILERPTLAVPPRAASAGFRGVIAVPVEVEN